MCLSPLLPPSYVPTLPLTESTLPALVCLLRALPPTSPPALLISTHETNGSTSYCHCSTLLLHHDTLYWLDPERPSRSNITSGHLGLANLSTLQSLTFHIHSLVPAVPISPPPFSPSLPPTVVRLPTLSRTPRCDFSICPPTSKRLATPPTHLSTHYTFTTYNANSLLSRPTDLRDLITDLAPHFLFIQETHLYNTHESLVRKGDLGVIASQYDYHVFLSSVPNPGTLHTFLPHTNAPGGIALLVRSHIARLSTRIPVPPSLSGYIVHLTLPLSHGATLHVLNLYLPPTNPHSDPHLISSCQSYLSDLIASLDPTLNFFIVGTDCNHRLGPLHKRDPSFHTFLSSCHLLPINATIGHHLTHTPSSCNTPPTMIDDILISSSLLSPPSLHTLYDISCPPPRFHQYSSDHCPITVRLPTSLLPFTFTTSPVPHPSPILADDIPRPPFPSLPSILLKQPIPPNCRTRSRQAIASQISTPSDVLNTTSLQFLDTLIQDAGGLSPNSSHPLLPYNTCKSRITAAHPSLRQTVESLALSHSTLLVQSLSIMHKICPTRCTTPTSSMPLNTKGRNPLFFFPRKAQCDINILRRKRQILSYATGLFLRNRYDLLDANSDGIMPHANVSMSVLLFTSLLDNSDFTTPIPDCHNLPDAIGTIPQFPFPPSRCPDQLSAWQSWLDLCKAKQRSLRLDHRRIVHSFRPTIRSRRYLISLLHVSKKSAHRKIFQGNLASDDSWTGSDPLLSSSSTITVLTDPTSHRTLTDSHSIASLTHSTFSNLWAADPTVNPTHPYPFLHTSSDTFSLSKSITHSPSPTLLPYVFRQHTFDTVLRRLKNNKSPGPDGIPNELIRLMPSSFKSSLRRLFLIFWLTGITPTSWKESLTTLLHKKDDPSLLANKRPIGLINTISKVWTRFVTEVLSSYAEDNHILSNCQEGFRAHHNTSRHLQRLVHTLEDARSSHRNIYGLYIDLTSAFNTISHSHLFRILHDLGFPPDAIDSVRDIYSNVHTRIILNRSSQLLTDPIHVGRGTIQGDTLSPLIFLLFLEPLLRWLSVGGHGYTPTCLTSDPIHPQSHPCIATQSSPTFADDMLLLSPCHLRLQTQFEKVLRYCQWGGLSINASKCAVTGALHHATATGPSCTLDHHISLLRNQLANRFITLDGTHCVPFLHPTSSYKYLGVHMTFNLDFRQHLSDLITTTKRMASHLIMANLPPRIALATLQSVLRPKLTYSFCITPFSITDVHTLDDVLITVSRIIMGLAGRSGSNKTFPAQMLLCSTSHGGVGLTSLLADYITISTQTVTRALNDTSSDLGLLTSSMLQHQLKSYGQLPVSLLPRRRHFHALPLSLRQLSLMHMADISLHCSPTGPLHLLGNDMLQTLSLLLSPTSPTIRPTPSDLSSLLSPLWYLGLVSLTPLVEHRTDGSFLRPSSCLDCYGTSRQLSDIVAAKLALNHLTLLLSGTPFSSVHLHTSHTPLLDPPPPFRRGNQFRITIPHDLLQLLPSPTSFPPKRSLTTFLLRDPDVSLALSTLATLSLPPLLPSSERALHRRLSDLPIPLDPSYRTPHARSIAWASLHPPDVMPLAPPHPPILHHDPSTTGMLPPPPLTSHLSPSPPVSSSSLSLPLVTK